MERDTRIQHHGEDREALGGGAAPPVFRTSLFTFRDCRAFEEAFAGRGARPVYTRVSNPTTRILEQKVADLEEMEDGIALASGMGAVSATLLGLLAAGDHLVMIASAYAPTLALARGPLARLGVETTLVAANDFADLERHLRPSTRLVYVESPASLTFDIVDLRAVAATAHAHDCLTVIDNSWATPVFQRPSRFGIDLALHSGTKYLSGHSDTVLGVVAGSRREIERVRETALLLGASLSPDDAALAIRGLRTLPLRMARHQQSALEIARFLAAHPRVERVLHPGLETFPAHDLARSQLEGWSGLFSFVLDGDPRALADALEIFRIGVSWGGFESLVLPIACTMPPQADTTLRTDLPERLVRLSIGLEDAGDLIRDLERGLSAAGG